MNEPTHPLRQMDTSASAQPSTTKICEAGVAHSDLPLGGFFFRGYSSGYSTVYLTGIFQLARRGLIDLILKSCRLNRAASSTCRALFLALSAVSYRPVTYLTPRRQMLQFHSIPTNFEKRPCRFTNTKKI